MRTFCLALFFFLLLTPGLADVRLPKLFADNMVIQRDKAIAVWGWATPNEKISLQFNRQNKSVTAGKNGKWTVSLAPESAGGPYQLVVKGKNTLTIRNILIGDVWVCSGQSNMEWTVRNSNNAMEEISNGNYPTIRHIKIPNTVATSPQEDISAGEWKVCTPADVADFTAVGYFFARNLTKELNVPIGLINTTWGGTHSETWTSREAFEGSDEFREMIAALPKLNLDSLARAKGAATVKAIEDLQGPLHRSPASASAWKENQYDDSQWKKMPLPDIWEHHAPFNEFDGVMWFRRSFQVGPGDAGKNGMLELAMIDDIDNTYVNGVLVGTTRQYNEKRNYAIPSGVLKEGTNTIAVRVEDTGGGGGIYGDGSNMKITIGNVSQPLAGDWRYRVESISKNTSSIGPNSYPTLLYNAMLHPLIPFGIKGVIWYQGESNAWRAYQYRKAFPLMINDWRKRWGQGDFPFYFVQLASFNAGDGNSNAGSNWAELREAQTLTLSLPNTGMAATTDIGDPHDIHPRNKQDVGKRLAAIALNRTYGKKMTDSGPVYQSMKKEGNKVRISFTSTGSGMVVKDKYGYLRGFELAGPDKVFRFAKASIEGNTVVVHHDSIPDPVAVRFGWADDASDNNLFNAEGFPALPFRTDTWKGITEESKFRF
jgi:sialate O-acetylesterase